MLVTGLHYPLQLRRFVVRSIAPHNRVICPGSFVLSEIVSAPKLSPIDRSAHRLRNLEEEH
jgi:hypothetical protein